MFGSIWNYILTQFRIELKNHLLEIFLIVLGMALSMLIFENLGLRKRVTDIEHQYDKFMALKSGSEVLGDRIKPGSFAVFIRGKDRVGCAVLKN